FGGSFFFVKMEQKPIIMAFWGMFYFAMIYGLGGKLLDNSPAKSSRSIADRMYLLAKTTKEPIKNLAFVGFSARQLRQSFPFYVERRLAKPKEWTLDEALQVLETNEPTLLLVGEDVLG